MQIILPFTLASFIFASSLLPVITTTNQDAVLNEVPSYAKWGRLAMANVKAKYPNAQIIDYLHIGRDTGASSSTEKFKLWLRENNREFGVFVDIEFENETEQVIQINYRETTR
ncbi:YqzG/YhdC family protein [Lederbergia graminis]|uniref:YqzG/YhdC family protein n=1 Tax=Lederbergia graminis TaxID=735518 RepID=A0ABW0LCL7_9BACI|nr:YqzG/YhdC family protein [Bacillaceae bacterium]